MEYDVIVIGGGISGTVSAIASARCGAKTLLVERFGYLGGMLTAGGVGPMMTFHAGEKQVVKGITDELIMRLKEKGKSPGHIYDTTGYTYTVTPFDAEALKHELELMFLESGGKLLYHTMLVGAEVKNNEITEVKVCNKQGISSLRAKVFIDATGDADLAYFSGVDYQKGRIEDGVCQPLTMNMKVINVNIAKIKEYIKQHPEEFPRIKDNLNRVDYANRLSIGGFVVTLNEAIKNKELSGVRQDLLFFETNNPGEVIVNTSRLIGYDPTDPWSLTEAEIDGRKHVRELERFLKTKVVGFENAIVLYSGPTVGVRSSRQIKGLYTLTLEDLISCKKFTDCIAHGGYPVDIHPPKGNEDPLYIEKVSKIMHIQKGEVYSIPYRCLINKQIINLITVGRCISTTFEAQGAIRVTPIVGAIGHGGGVAAALAALNDLPVDEVNIYELQKTLIKQNAYLEI